MEVEEESEESGCNDVPILLNLAEAKECAEKLHYFIMQNNDQVGLAGCEDKMNSVKNAVKKIVVTSTICQVKLEKWLKPSDRSSS